MKLALSTKPRHRVPHLSYSWVKQILELANFLPPGNCTATEQTGNTNGQTGDSQLLVI